MTVKLRGWVVLAYVALLLLTPVSAVWTVHYLAKQNSSSLPPSQVLAAWGSCIEQAQHANERKPGSPVPSLTADQIRDCNAKLSTTEVDAYTKEHLDQLKWMLTTLGSLAVIFALAQAASAYFNANSAQKTVDDAIKRINDAEAELHANYPIFSAAEKLRSTLYVQIDAAFSWPAGPSDNGPVEAIDYLDGIYKDKLTFEMRQKLLSVESFISIDLNQGSLSDERYNSLLQKLALIYHSKFLYDQARLGGSFSDLERAQYYLEKSTSPPEKDFMRLNELGWVFSTMARFCKDEASKRKYFDDSCTQFSDSASINQQQQRALYNLAAFRIERIQPNASPEQRVEAHRAAVALLKRALDGSHPNWQHIPVPFATGFVYFNLACSQSRLLETGDFTPADVIRSLEGAAQSFAQSGIPERMKDIEVDREFEAAGDFFGLYNQHANAAERQELDRLRLALKQEQPQPKPAPSTVAKLWQRLRTRIDSWMEP